MARPMPELAPVTIATLPANKFVFKQIPPGCAGLPYRQPRPIQRMQPDIKLAATLFDTLDRTTRRGRGIDRDSYGDGEQTAHDLMRATAESLALEISVDAIGNL